MERLNLSCMVGYPACRKPAGSLQGLHIVAFGVPNDLAASKLCVELFDIPCFCRPQRSEMVRRKVLAFLSSDCLCLFFLLLLSRFLALLLFCSLFYIPLLLWSLWRNPGPQSRSFPSSISKRRGSVPVTKGATMIRIRPQQMLQQGLHFFSPWRGPQELSVGWNDWVTVSRFHGYIL